MKLFPSHAPDDRSPLKFLNSIRKRIAETQIFPAIVERYKCKFILDPDNWIDKRLIAGIDYEGEQIALALSLTREIRASQVFDVGANFGLYTAILGSLPEVRRVYAFEPVRRNIAQLNSTVFVNRLWDKVVVFPHGLSDQDKNATIYIDPKSTGVSRIDLSTGDRSREAFSDSEVISLKAFDGYDAFKDMHGERCFLKVDVEGEAASVLSGMAKFLSKNYCVIQIELSPEEVFGSEKILDELNYVNVKKIGSDYYYKSRLLIE